MAVDPQKVNKGDTLWLRGRHGPESVKAVRVQANARGKTVVFCEFVPDFGPARTARESKRPELLFASKAECWQAILSTIEARAKSCDESAASYAEEAKELRAEAAAIRKQIGYAELSVEQGRKTRLTEIGNRC